MLRLDPRASVPTSTTILRSLALGWVVCLLSVTAVGAETVISVNTTAAFTNALTTVQDGEIIELAAGNYNSPVDGWILSMLTKSFTIRAADGATVNFDGQSANPIFKIFTSAGGTVVFENVNFIDGQSTENGTAGAVTLNEAEATFIGCDFTNNEAIPSNTGGGGLAVFVDSTAHVIDSNFTNNRARNEGAGLKVGGGSHAYVHNTTFTGNRTDLAGHRPSAAGAAIHVGNASVDVSNSRFDSNVSGCIAGGIFAFGDFTGTSDPVTQVKIANSTFVDNLVAPNGVTCNFFGSGGAIHAEDSAEIKVYNSRFFTNAAEDGGAISMYRSTLEVYDSVFRGNDANGVDDRGNGGAIAASSQDGSGDANNEPSASILIRDSFFQGRFGATGNAGLRGGCIWTLGDTNRTFGLQGVPQNGNATTNRTVLDISGTVFYDCDVNRQEGFVGSGFGGAMSISHTDLTLTDSMVIDCDSTGTNAAGGGLRGINESLMTITGTTFANNTASLRGAAIDGSGSEIQVDNSQFMNNNLTVGSLGSVIYSAASKNVIAGTIDLGMSGAVRNSTFKGSNGTVLADADFSCASEVEPINTVVYNNNDFHTPTPGANVYHNGAVFFNGDVSELNGVTINRTLCANTNKSTIANTALGSEPDLVALLGVPPQILPVNAAGDAGASTDAFVAYAWCGGSTGTLNGDGLGSETGIQTATATTYTLASGGASEQVTVTNGPNPNASLIADPIAIDGGQSSDLSWSTTAGQFLCMSIDRNVSTTSASSGTVTVTPQNTQAYNLHLITEEGGVHAQAKVYVDELPGAFFADGFESGSTASWLAVGE